MARPYLKVLTDVVGSVHPPELDEVSFILAALGNQEDKLIAIQSHLLSSLLRHYANAASHPQCANVRLVMTQILESLVMLMNGRDALFAADAAGATQTLSILRDASAAVRRQACKFFATLASFPDSQSYLSHGRAVITALYHTFLNDSIEVAIDAIPALTFLCQYDHVSDAAAIKKLVEILRSHSSSINTDRNSLAIVHSVLRCLWTMSADIKRKDVAIGAGAVPVIAALVDGLDEETRRLSIGALSAISISSPGKLAIIDIPPAVQTICCTAIDKKTPETIRANSIITIRNVIEQPRGLHACARWLLHDETVIDIMGHAATARAIAPLLDDPARLPVGLDALWRLISDEAGRAAAFDILELVPRLYTLQHTATTHAAPSSSSSSGAAHAVNIPDLSTKCLALICKHNSWAQRDLDKINRLMSSAPAASPATATTPVPAH